MLWQHNYTRVKGPQAAAAAATLVNVRDYHLTMDHRPLTGGRRGALLLHLHQDNLIYSLDLTIFIPPYQSLDTTNTAVLQQLTGNTCIFYKLYLLHIHHLDCNNPISLFNFS